MKTIRVGTRNSPLAMKQTRIILALLKEVHGDFPVEIVPITTKGDRLLSVSLAEIGGKGLFINEVEQALLKGSLDFAVHSLKDMPAHVTEGLTLAAIPKRNDPRDCLIFREASAIEELPLGAAIGTSSLRREFQIKQLKKKLQVQSIRGNVGTRLHRMEERQLDGIILAVAGLKRLNWFETAAYPHLILTEDQCVPAIGQGALAVECCQKDTAMRAFLAPINDEITRELVTEERQFLATLNGNCDYPIGAHAKKVATGYQFSGFLGQRHYQKSVTETVFVKTIQGVGERMAQRLAEQLGMKIS